MMKRLEITLIAPLIWLLLLCSSQVEVEAQQDTVKPKLVWSRPTNGEIDICKELTEKEKEFTLSIDIGTINKTDSLFVAEIILAYKKNKVLINGYLTIGNLFEQFKSEYTNYQSFPGESDDEYNYIMLQGMSILMPLNGSAKLAQFTGKILTDSIECIDFYIYDIYFGKEFKKPYIGQNTGETELCLVNKNLPERKIEFFDIKDNYVIDSLEVPLKIDYYIKTNNKKNLKNFNIELNINNLFFDDIKISNLYTDYVVENITDTTCIIKVENIDTANINSTKIFTAEFTRKRKEQANVIINCKINEINECACAMNGEMKDIEINLPDLTSIIGELVDKITILENDNNILLKSTDEIMFCKLINLYGNEVDYGITKIGQNEVLFDKTKLVNGIYFVKILTNSKINNLQNIKLIIN